MKLRRRTPPVCVGARVALLVGLAEVEVVEAQGHQLEVRRHVPDSHPVASLQVSDQLAKEPADARSGPVPRAAGHVRPALGVSSPEDDQGGQTGEDEVSQMVPPMVTGRGQRDGEQLSRGHPG